MQEETSHLATSCLMVGLGDTEFAPLLSELVLPICAIHNIHARHAVKLKAPARYRHTLFDEVAEADFLLVAPLRDESLAAVYLGFAKALEKPVILLARSEEQLARLATLVDAAVRYVRLSSKGNLTSAAQRARDQLWTDLRGALAGAAIEGRRRRLGIVRAFPSAGGLDWQNVGEDTFRRLIFELLLQQGAVEVVSFDSAREISFLVQICPVGLVGEALREHWAVLVGGRSLDGLRRSALLLETREILRRISEQQDRADGIQLTLLLIPSPKCPASDRLLADLLKVAAMVSGSTQFSESVVKARLWTLEMVGQYLSRRPNLVERYRSQLDSGAERSPTLLAAYLNLATQADGILNARESEARRRGREETRRLEDLAFAAAHGFGNMLFALENRLDLLLLRTPQDSPDRALLQAAKEALEICKHHNQRFKRIVEPEEDELSAVPLIPQIESALKLAEQMGVRVIRTFEEELPPVMGEAGGLQEIFQELATNSLRWTDGKTPELSVGVKRATPSAVPQTLKDPTLTYVEVTFADNGRGVPSHLKEDIFRPFFTQHPQGKGIGLTLIRQTLDRYGGAISEAGYPGHGALFRIFFQIA